MSRKSITLAAAVVAAMLAAAWWARQDGDDRSDGEARTSRVAVEAAAVTTGSVADVREFTGTLEAGDAFTVAPKTGGQIERVHVDIGDRVERGQVVVRDRKSVV